MKNTDICAPLLAAKSEDEWSNALRTAAVGLGLEQVHFVTVSVAPTGGGSRFQSTTLTPRWQEYLERQCMTGNDIAVDHCRTQTTPFVWMPEAFATERSTNIYASAAADGLRIGLVLPAHGPFGSSGMFALFADRAASARNIGEIARRLPALAALRDGALESSRRFCAARAQATDLSARERECLQWLLTGKSSRDIAQIMNIAEATVNFHVAHLCKKLGTSSRLVAAARAVKLGLVEFE